MCTRVQNAFILFNLFMNILYHIYIYIYICTFSCLIFHLSDVSILLKINVLNFKLYFILLCYITYIIIEHPTSNSNYHSFIFIVQILYTVYKHVRYHFLKYFRYLVLSNESSNSSIILTFCFGFLASNLRLRSSSLIEAISKGN